MGTSGAASFKSFNVTSGAHFTLNGWWLILSILLLPLVIFLIYRFIVFINSEFVIRKKRWMESEISHFQLLGDQASRRDPVGFYDQMLKWYDHFRSLEPEPGPGLGQFIASSGDKELMEGYEWLKQTIYGKMNAGKWSTEKVYLALKHYRNKCIAMNRQSQESG